MQNFPRISAKLGDFVSEEKATDFRKDAVKADFLRQIRDSRFMWDKRDSRFKRLDLQRPAWEELAKNFGFTTGKILQTNSHFN